MVIDIEKVTSGSMNGEYVWVCGYRQPDLNKKPIRNVPPQKVLVASADSVKGNVYYSKSVFLKLNKKGEPTKSAIKVFDNTGYRFYTGVSVNVFDNEAECKAKWKDQVSDVIGQLEYKKSIAVLAIQNQIDDLNSMLK